MTSTQPSQAPVTHGPLAHGPLDGVKVLDLSEDIAGSFCGRLLADYGADVLKVEPPTGAALRRMGPFFGNDPHPEKSLFFLLLNLNKKGATLNLDIWLALAWVTTVSRPRIPR